jgi:hypothetical protein
VRILLGVLFCWGDGSDFSHINNLLAVEAKEIAKRIAKLENESSVARLAGFVMRSALGFAGQGRASHVISWAEA